jgi:hypothetical protein
MVSRGAGLTWMSEDIGSLASREVGPVSLGRRRLVRDSSVQQILVGLEMPALAATKPLPPELETPPDLAGALVGLLQEFFRPSWPP